MPKITTHHICVPVSVALDKLQKGQNLFFPTPPSEVYRVLNEYKDQGKEYITGCAKENAEGRCGGHEGEPVTN